MNFEKQTNPQCDRGKFGNKDETIPKLGIKTDLSHILNKKLEDSSLILNTKLDSTPKS